MDTPSTAPRAALVSEMDCRVVVGRARVSDSANDLCPRSRDLPSEVKDVLCRGTDGLYVITPEAVAAAE